jgi:hypothetical protein
VHQIAGQQDAIGSIKTGSRMSHRGLQRLPGIDSVKLVCRIGKQMGISKLNEANGFHAVI